MKKVTRRNILLGAVAAGGTAGIVGAGFIPVARQARAQELTINDVLFDQDNPVLGNPDGDVTIVEFFDYQCPYCKINHPALSRTVAEDGNVRLVMKDWPIFGAPSIRASQLVLGAADLGAYSEANAALMATEARLSEVDINTALENAGLDIAELDAAFRSNRDKWEGLMARNDRQAAQLGLQGTPAFIIGTTIYPGFMDGAALKDAIAQSRG
ncbi:disulfide bond formation protein DsbA [Pelagivirga sediminicola]|uniref:Disulfide bond formation protein DsbA n=1 Tax=Pelagivirga sediminicola TaxID=2170575 RepID=A0A2T7G8H4_9RHOB|nr:DsbA family protein [Pelagivirga sediminicola]PVA10723.1 disulfide bond formation protein DsbA [Pelagivirga sediminicola]